MKVTLAEFHKKQKTQLPTIKVELQELAVRRRHINDDLQKTNDEIEAVNKNNSGNDTPGGMALRALSEDKNILVEKLTYAISYFSSIENRSADEESMLKQLETATSNLQIPGSEIAYPLQRLKDVVSAAESMKLAATGEMLKLDPALYMKHIQAFAKIGAQSKLTSKDLADAIEKFPKKAPKL